MDAVTPSIRELFAPLIGVPSWNVMKGYGGFLTFEFGTPSLEIREPMMVEDATPRVRRLFAKRNVTVHGQWHLWIYCCGWRIFRCGNQLAHNESTDEEIAAACLELDGQKIQEVKCYPDVGFSRFFFDLGGMLETGPYDNELLEQWMLFLPDGNVFTYRSDGAVHFGPGDQADDSYEWTPCRMS